MTRAFVAAVPPARVLDAVGHVAGRLADALGQSARPTRRSQWHLTVQFLGDDADLDEVASALSTLAHPDGTVALGGLGAFPSALRARVCWLGVASGAEWLASLSAAVGEILTPVGYEPESRDFLPHVTLARTRSPIDVRRSLCIEGAESVGDPFTVGEIVLFESVPARAGMQHRAHATFRLGA